MNLTKVKKLLPILIVILVVLLVVVLVILNNTEITLKQGSTPDTDPIYLKEAADTLRARSSPDPLQYVARLILKLPYKGSNFTFEYSYDDNGFTLTLKKDFVPQGTTEFDNFLTQNNVDKKYLKNLKIQIK